MTNPTLLPTFPPLRHGDTGSAVRILQKRLGLATDGIFGADTASAVLRWQKANNLKVDAVAGPLTMASLGIPVRLGIDVSHHQGDIDWQAVAKAGITWAAIKFTEGADWLDKQAVRNASGAYHAGITDLRLYHFATPKPTPYRDPEIEAEWFVNQLYKLDGMLPGYLSERLALDIESDPADMNPYQMDTWASRFVEEVRKRTGRVPLVYTYSSFLRHQMAGGLAVATAGTKLWVARLSTANDPGYVGQFSCWDVWQWSWKGRVPGIKGDVDLNWVLPNFDLVQPLSPVGCPPDDEQR